MRGQKGFTLTELLVSVVIIVIVIATAFGTFLFVRIVYDKDIIESELQRDSNVIVETIIRGLKEQGAHFGLRSAVSYTLPAISPAGSEVDFTGLDGNTRKYFLNGLTIQYFNPAALPHQKAIYSAPSGTTITLRFWEPAGYLDHETVGIYVGLSQQSRGNTITGSVSTYTNLRNVPK